MELVLELSLEEEEFDEPPEPPAPPAPPGPPAAPPLPAGPLANAALKTPCSSVGSSDYANQVSLYEKLDEVALRRRCHCESAGPTAQETCVAGVTDFATADVPAE